MENTVGFGCYFFVQRDEACTLWLWRRCVVDSRRHRRFFVPYGSLVYLSTQLTSHTRNHCSRINDHSNLTADFCGYPTLPWNRPGSRIYRLTLQSGVTQAYIGLLLLHLNFQKNLIGVVHWGNPPSPWTVYRFDSGVHWTVPPWVYGYIIAYFFCFDNWQIVRNTKLFFVYKGDFVYNAQLFLDTASKV